MRKILSISVLCLFAIVSAQNTGKIKGVVKSSDGSTLEGANVFVEGTGIGSASGEGGNYTVLNVPVGSYSISFEYIGYTSKIIDGVRVNTDLTTVLNIELEVSAVEGAEVRVFAEKPLVKRDATNTRRVVSSDVIETLPLRSVDNIVGLQTGVVDNHIRGGRSGDNAYYVDGVLMKDHWGGSNATGSLSQTGMEEISLEAGGFGAEYGGANGGIINVTSKSGGQKLAASVETVRDLGETTAGTSQDKIYSYGYSLNNFEVGGPVSDRFRYWLMV